MKVNIDGIHNALNIARDFNSSVFIPSTIATMGPNLEKKPVPDDVLQEPISIMAYLKYIWRSLILIIIENLVLNSDV
jgi:threonine 3-dehydrogenase